MAVRARLHSRGLDTEIAWAGEGLPSPLREIPDLQLWVKDDGQYGRRYGGSKLRKLEWLLPNGDDVHAIVTASAAGATHGLAVAAYARDLGVPAHIAVVDQPNSDHVLAQFQRLNELATAVYRTGTTARTLLRVPPLLAKIALQHRSWPTVLPAGGSNALGALGYVEAALELADQLGAVTPTEIVLPVGSGGTIAGLAVGLALAELPIRLIGVIINDHPRPSRARVERLIHATQRLLTANGVKVPTRRVSFTLDNSWIGKGFGHHTPAGEAAVVTADKYGLTLEPVFSGKAFAAALTRARDHRVLFLNTFDPRADDFFPLGETIHT